MGLWLDPLAQLSHTSSWQWWSDCWLMRSQNSVAPQYCKIKPDPTLLKTARQMKAVDRLPIPWSCTLMTDALVSDIHPQQPSIFSRPLRLSVEVTFINNKRLSDQVNAELVCNRVKWWVLGYVYIRWSWWRGSMGRLSVHAYSWSSQTSRYLVLKAAVERNIEKE